MDWEPLGEVGTPAQLGDKIHFRACALSPYRNAGSLKTRQNGNRAKIVQKNFVSQLQEFYPYCIEDTDKSTPEKIVLRINLENEEKAENFKNRYSVVSNTNWIVYGCTPNPQRFVFSKTWICHNSNRHKQNARRNADYGMSPIEAIRFHENKFLLEENFMGLANASINPTHNQIYYLHKCWRDANLGSSINPFDKLKEKVPFYESIGTTVKVHEDHLWAVLLVTPLMKRNHHLFSSKEIIFIDSTSSCEASSSTITILLSATKVGALPLAVMIHASQSIQNYINAFQLLKMNFPQCFGGQDVMYADSERNLLEAQSNLLTKCEKYPDYTKRFTNFFGAKKEWILFFRNELITRNHNTNNFSEASIRILKDVILCRARAFNVIALCEFFIGIWEDYFTKKFEFASSRRLSVTVLYDKIGKKSADFIEHDVQELLKNLFQIKSGENKYIIKKDVGVCSCPSGSTGAFCKHQCALMELKKIRLPNAPPVTPEDKHELALLVLGSKCPPKNFFCYFKNNELSSDRIEFSAFEMPVEHETDNNASSTNEGQMIKAQQITNYKIEAILNELKRIEDVVKIADFTEESGDRLLKTLGKIQASQDLKSIYVFKKRIFRGKIKVQPTSIARRKSLIRSSRRIPSGRPLKTEKKIYQKKKKSEL
ncbi:SWIM-type domain-containing protein [Trichonephila clavipes]|nr:SWIM-type domain-containing protein [Trichonephila clavipes]